MGPYIAIKYGIAIKHMDHILQNNHPCFINTNNKTISVTISKKYNAKFNIALTILTTLTNIGCVCLNLSTHLLQVFLPAATCSGAIVDAAPTATAVPIPTAVIAASAFSKDCWFILFFFLITIWYAIYIYFIYKCNFV